jgi:hypothetical protein
LLASHIAARSPVQTASLPSPLTPLFHDWSRGQPNRLSLAELVDSRPSIKDVSQSLTSVLRSGVCWLGKARFESQEGKHPAKFLANYDFTSQIMDTLQEYWSMPQRQLIAQASKVQ